MDRFSFDGVITAQGSNGAALANYSLSPFITLSGIASVIATLAPNSLTTAQIFPNTGDLNPGQMVALQSRGLTISNALYSRAATIQFNSTTGEPTLFSPTPSNWSGRDNRSFSDVPKDFAEPVDDYVAWESAIARTVHVLSLIEVLCTIIGIVLYANYVRKMWIFTLIQGSDKHASIQSQFVYDVYTLNDESFLARLVGGLKSKFTPMPIALLAIPIIIILAVIEGQFPMQSASVYDDLSGSYHWTCTATTTVQNLMIL
eukprot:jgi/Hompol1/4227/HPOL_003522-RA